jgi:MFS transporter, PAT family, beta-lactamase induction signal transducer AmpG
MLFWWMSRTGLVDAAMGTAGGQEPEEKIFE